jgi:HSP20 family protein
MKKMFDLIPWRKREGKEIVGFRRELDNLFNRFFESDFPSPREFLNGGGWYPSVDISEESKAITVKAEIPGVESEDLNVTLDGRRLTIRGEKKQEKEEKEENLHRVERYYGSFTRTIELPAEVDPDKIDASYKKGVLKIVLKKTKESESKTIRVKSES